MMIRFIVEEDDCFDKETCLEGSLSPFLSLLVWIYINMNESRSRQFEVV